MSLQGNHTALGTQSSSSFVQSTQTFNVTYGSGTVEGLLCQDNVNIAGLELMNHTFGVTTTESVQFASDATAFDGIMGLAHSVRSSSWVGVFRTHLVVQKLSQEQVLNPVESLAAKKLIQAPITSFKIPRLADQLNDGEVTFGGLDATKFINNSLVTFPNVNTVGFWEGAMDAIMVNGTNTGLTGRTAILDTGTTLILAPPADAKQVVESLGGTCDTQQCTIPCTTGTSLALAFGNASFAIDPRDLAVLPINPDDPTGSCTAGIQPQQIGAATEWLVSAVDFILGPRLSTRHSGWRCFPEECLFLHQHCDERDLSREGHDLSCHFPYTLYYSSLARILLSLRVLIFSGVIACIAYYPYIYQSDNTRLFKTLVVQTTTSSGEVLLPPLHCPLTGLVTKRPGCHKHHDHAEQWKKTRTNSAPAVTIIANRGLKRTHLEGPGCPSKLARG